MYKCNCTPKQKYPHIVKTPSSKTTHFKILGINIGSLTRNITPAMSCDDKPVPKKKWSLTLGGYHWKPGYPLKDWRIFTIEFGKIIY